MDHLDMVWRIEKTFGLELKSEDFVDLMEKGDLRVGTLYGYILQQKGYRDTIRTSFGLNLEFWREIRRVLHEISGRSLAEIQLATPLGEIFPRGTRVHDWRHFRKIAPWEIASLNYSAAVRYTGLLLALALLAWDLLQWQKFFGQDLWQVLLIVLGIVIFAESYAKVFWFLQPLRRSFPARMRTVKDLCRVVLAGNALAIAESYRQHDARLSAEVWEQPIQIIVDVSGVDRSEIHFNSQIVRDLGFG